MRITALAATTIVGVLGAWGGQEIDPHHQVKLQGGDLTVVIGDHAPHAGSERANYEGIHHLSHRTRPENLFRPIYAGMIGVRRECRVEGAGEKGARVVAGTGADRVVETFVVQGPHYVDYSVTFTARDARGGWNNTCYMNNVEDPGIYVRRTDGSWARHYSARHGHQASVAPEGMALPPVEKVPNALYPHGTNRFHEGFSDLRFDPRFPVVYGRVGGMVFIYMAERKRGDQFIPYMSPTGGGGPKNPAWDFRYHLTGLETGKEQSLHMRLCYKPWAGEEDVLKEYEAWAAAGPRRP